MHETANTMLHEYSFVFPFEESFSPTKAKGWLQENWHTSVYYSLAYVIFIFSVKAWMCNSRPFSLRTSLILWNWTLAVFSIFCFVRVLPEFIHKSKDSGLYGTVCDQSFLLDDKVSSFWAFLFVLSKLVEFGDTVFIVLRKAPLIFLHWYHHVLTLMYGWFTYSEGTSAARWFVTMNAFIHSFMYSYYALKAMRVYIPKPLSAVITSSQIIQMFIGCFINFKAYFYMSNNRSCGISSTNLVVSFLMYLSYFGLFIRFFYLSYLSKFRSTKKTS